MEDASGINIEVSHESQPGTVGAGRVCYATLVVCGWRKLESREKRRRRMRWESPCISSSSENGRIRSEQLQPGPLFPEEARSREIWAFDWGTEESWDHKHLDISVSEALDL